MSYGTCDGCGDGIASLTEVSESRLCPACLSGAYVIGANMIGYLPEGEPYVLTDCSQDYACRALANEVERDWDSHAMEHDAPEDADTCETCGEYLNAHTEIHNGATDAYVGYVHYWAVPAAMVA